MQKHPSGLNSLRSSSTEDDDIQKLLAEIENWKHVVILNKEGHIIGTAAFHKDDWNGQVLHYGNHKQSIAEVPFEVYSRISGLLGE